MTPHGPAPTFIWPAVSALRWAVLFCVAMVADPTHTTLLGWACLAPFCIHSWRAVNRLGDFVARRVALDFQRQRAVEVGAAPTVGA